MAGGERQFVRWLAQATRQTTEGISVGLGDDMAALAVSGLVLVSCDLLLDGTHFDTRHHSWGAIGAKAANCGLSDCAAMAVQPRAVVVSVAWPRGGPAEDLQALMSGVIDACRAFGCGVVGGDTTSWPHPLAIDVTVLAEPYPGVAPVRRSGAKAGDGVYVTGPLGGSLLGKHLDFVPRVHEAERIARALGPRLHAMMDITDGLAIDLDRLAEASGTGALLTEDAVLAVATPAALAAARDDGRSVLAHVLHDGEDFELLLAAELRAGEAEALGLQAVGAITSAPGLHLQRSGGAIEPLAPEGYEHL